MILVRMHPMLGRALTKAAGASAAYKAWALALATAWSYTRIVCAAHSSIRRLPEDGFSAEVALALEKVSATLGHHRAR